MLDPFNVVKARFFFSPSFFIRRCLGYSSWYWIWKSPLFRRVSQAKQEWKLTLLAVFLSCKNVCLDCDIRMTFSCQNVSCDTVKLKNNPWTVFLPIKSTNLCLKTWLFVHVLSSIIPPIFLCVLSVQFYVGLPNYFSAITPVHFVHVCVSALLCTIAAKSISSDCLVTQREQETGSACCHGAAWMLCSDKHCPVTLGKARCYCLDRPANMQTRVRVSESVHVFLHP